MQSKLNKEILRYLRRHLDDKELVNLLKDMGYAPSQAKNESKQMLSAADVNNDGVIDFNEFKQIWHRRLLSNHDKYIHGVFGVFDDNCDGFIDGTELQSVLNENNNNIKIDILWFLKHQYHHHHIQAHEKEKKKKEKKKKKNMLMIMMIILINIYDMI